MPKTRNTKSAQSQATIERLVAAAKREFSTNGYARTATEDIVRQANCTRGALYHHFKDKKDLFYAAFIASQKEIGRRIEDEADAEDDLWRSLISGCRAFLKACSDPRLQQIVVIDAPSVLDWNAYRQVDLDLPGSGLWLLRACLQGLLDQKKIQPLPVDALTHLLSGAMDEAALWVAQSRSPQQALSEALTTIEVLLEGIRLQSV
ncbi:MAG: TetR/AcrR family transcriptional regulator [Desulfosarcina sp.]